MSKSSSRNPLEQPWLLTPEEFVRRARKISRAGILRPGSGQVPDLRLFTTVRDETAALTEQTQEVEREIDRRVEGLYGL